MQSLSFHPYSFFHRKIDNRPDTTWRIHCNSGLSNRISLFLNSLHGIDGFLSKNLLKSPLQFSKTVRPANSGNHPQCQRKGCQLGPLLSFSCTYDSPEKVILTFVALVNGDYVRESFSTTGSFKTLQNKSFVCYCICFSLGSLIVREMTS